MKIFPILIKYANNSNIYMCILATALSFPSISQPNSARVHSTNREALEKIANNKINWLSKDVPISFSQKKKIKGYFVKEAILIDSLKYLPSEFYEDPLSAREAIILIKRNTEEKVNQILTEQQRITLESVRESKRKAALRKLQQVEGSRMKHYY